MTEKLTNVKPTISIEDETNDRLKNQISKFNKKENLLNSIVKKTILPSIKRDKESSVDNKISFSP